MKKLLVPIICLALVSCFGASKEPTSTVSLLKPGQTEIETGKDVITTAMPQGERRDMVHGKEVFLGIGAIDGEGEYKANGVGQLSVFEDGYSRASVRVNIQISEPSTFYQAWLVNESNDDRISLDTLRNRFKDTRYFGNMETQTDMSQYNNVIVTLQKITDSDKLGQIVAKGVIKNVTPKPKN